MKKIILRKNKIHLPCVNCKALPQVWTCAPGHMSNACMHVYVYIYIYTRWMYDVSTWMKWMMMNKNEVIEVKDPTWRVIGGPHYHPIATRNSGSYSNPHATFTSSVLHAPSHCPFPLLNSLYFALSLSHCRISQ